MFFSRKSALGVACTRDGATALRLVRADVAISGCAWRIADARRIDWREEGLATAEEARQAARDWLRENRLDRAGEAYCLLPQERVNTVISDFPPVHAHAELEKMVAYQTGQLAGLSENELANDFQEVPPLDGQTNPLLIAVAQENALEEWGDLYCGAGVCVGALVPAALALQNAFALLQPEHANAESGMQVLLECDEQNPTLLLLWRGTVLHIRTLPKSEDTPESLMQILQKSIRAWRETQMGDLRFAQPERLWISGAQAAATGFLEKTTELAGMPVEILGVPLRRCPQPATTGPVRNGLCPAMTLAFGLAAQRLKLAPATIALLPKRLAWQRERIAQFPFLAATAALLFFVLGGLFVNGVQNVRAQSRQLASQEAILDECLQSAPKLRAAYAEIANLQREILPLAEAAMRTHRFLRTIQAWEEAAPIPRKDNWCVYLADEFSFSEENSAVRATNAPANGKTTLFAGNMRRENAVPRNATLATTAAEETPPPQAPVLPTQALPVEKLPLLTKMYAGGVLPATSVRYQAIKEFQGELNRSELFANVDDFTDFLTEEFRKNNILPWQNFLSTYRNVLQKDYALFLLQLPFLETPVRQLPEEP